MSIRIVVVFMGDIDVNLDHDRGNYDRSFADEGNQWKIKTPPLDIFRCGLSLTRSRVQESYPKCKVRKMKLSRDVYAVFIVRRDYVHEIATKVFNELLLNAP